MDLNESQNSCFADVHIWSCSSAEAVLLSSSLCDWHWLRCACVSKKTNCLKRPQPSFSEQSSTGTEHNTYFYALHSAFSMSHRISCKPADAALWSKVSPCRRTSLTRQSRKSWKVSCEKPLRWSPVEDTKQKAVQIEQAVEHRMPDTHNLYVLDSQIKAFRHLNANSSVVVSACSRILFSTKHISSTTGLFLETAKRPVHSRFSSVTKQHSEGMAYSTVCRGSM